jgi:hypothetical protein
MYEIVRWVSIAFMWAAVGMNIFAFVRCQITYNRLKVQQKYCSTMIDACIEFMESQDREEDTDGRND